MQDSVYQKLTGNVRRLSRNHDVDAFHDAWLETGHSNHRNLCARAKLRVIDELRDFQRVVPSKVVEAALWRQRLREESHCPLTQLIQRELQIVVRTALGHLDALYRNVAIMHWIDGLTVIEISRKLSVPEKTLYTRLDRAKNQLRISLQHMKDSR